MHCNFSSCYTLKHIYTCIVCTQYLTSESVCQHDHFWTPIARSLTLGSLSSSSGSVPTTRPTICDFYLVDFAAGCRSLTFFWPRPQPPSLTIAEIGRHHLFLETDVVNPKWNDPTRIEVRKKVCEVSSGEWMERLVRWCFFQLFPLQME